MINKKFNKKGDIEISTIMKTIIVVAVVSIVFIGIIFFPSKAFGFLPNYAPGEDELIRVSETTPIQPFVGDIELEKLEKVISSSKGIIVTNNKIKSCACGINCDNYANAIKQISEEDKVDPLLILSMMIQESDCKVSSEVTGSVGLIQISLKDHCGNYGLDANIEKCRTQLLDPKTNFDVGIKILNEKYKALGTRHPMGNKLYCNNKPCSVKFENGTYYYEFQGCGKRNQYYSGWDAALRGYNGWSCNRNLPAQDYYVDNIRLIHKKLKENAEEN